MGVFLKDCKTEEEYIKAIEDKTTEIVKSLNGFTYDEVSKITEEVRNIMSLIPLEVERE